MARPNILLILADAVQAATLDPQHICQTPHLDRLARRGVRFTRAYSTTPVCSPSRASLMTGLLPHNHGVLQVEHGVDPDQCVLRTDRPHWAQRLTVSGYRTGYIGKWHIGRTHRTQDFGWQYSRCINSPEYAAAAERKIGLPPADRLDAALSFAFTGPDGYEQPWLLYGVTDVPPEERSVSLPAEFGEEFLDEALSGREPWCCCASFPEPNDQLVCSREVFDRYDQGAVDLPANLNAEFGQYPAVYGRARAPFQDMTPHQWRLARTCYYARITEIDRMAGRLLERIERAGQLENTVVVFTSDHGRYVGGHGMDGHNIGAFEELYNIPLIAAGPGIASGAVTDARVGLHDLCPTLLELAGLPPFESPDSRSFAGVLCDPTGHEREFTTGYAEYFGSRYWLTQRVLWQDDWKMVFNGFDRDELYNLREDPFETTNLANDPAQRARHRRMMAEIWRLVRRTNDATLLNGQWFGLRLGVVGPDLANE